MKTLCKCNMCNNILVDKNPQMDAKEHENTGLPELVLIDLVWVCPFCLTDNFLIDL